MRILYCFREEILAKGASISTLTASGGQRVRAARENKVESEVQSDSVVNN